VESRPSFFGTLLVIVLVVVGLERSVWAYKKFCKHIEGGQDTTGFSKLRTTIDEHEEAFEREEFGDEHMNERL
jgi:hypothetical protein